MTAETETRASEGAGGELVRELVLILSSVILTHEYEKIKAWLRDWFVELPKPKDPRRRRQLSVRVEDENRKVVERFSLEQE